MRANINGTEEYKMINGNHPRHATQSAITPNEQKPSAVSGNHPRHATQSAVTPNEQKPGAVSGV